MYRHAGRLRRLTIGRYPTLSLADARNEAREALRQAALGNDPASLKQQERQAGTFGELAGEYIERWAKKKKRSWLADQHLLERCLLPLFKNVRASEVSRKDARALLETMAETTPIQANRAHSLLSTIYSWANSVDLIEHNPCVGLRKPATENQRDRVLTEAELKKVWNAMGAEQSGFASLFKLCLLTVQRSGAEVRRMRWQDIDMDTYWWTIPAEFSKNGLTHRVPMSSPAMRIIETLQDAARSPWVFPGRSRQEHCQNIQIPFRRVRKLAGIMDVRIHDLRRTAASLMTGMGIPRLTVSKILNHAEPGVTAVYDRHSYDREKRDALDAWAKRLMVVVSELREAPEGNA